MKARRGASLAHRLLLRAYPSRWRQRYGEEFLDLLVARPLRLRDLPDVVGAALDARLHAGHAATVPSQLLPRRAELRVLSPPNVTYGVVTGVPPIGVLSRRGFMRRMLAAGVALLSIEFLGGTLSFLWPNVRQGLGARFRVGTLASIVIAQPSFASGELYPFNPARAFLVNVPAAEALAGGSPTSIANPGPDQLLALWRKCPHLGCLVPQPCDELHRIRCRCHGSTYNVLGEKLKEGPAERGLDRFAVSIERDGTVVIDTSQITQGAPNLGPDRLVFSDPHPWDATCDV
jgi:Rieske Fe-S protein